MKVLATSYFSFFIWRSCKAGHHFLNSAGLLVNGSSKHYSMAPGNLAVWRIFEIIPAVLHMPVKREGGNELFEYSVPYV